MKRFSIVMCAIVLVLIVLSVSQNRRSSALAMQSSPPGAINSPNLVFPSVRIVKFGADVARLDTATGEMWRFNGTISGASASGSWLRIVRPVTTATTGFLDLRVVGGGSFLVDLGSGETWVLRRSDSDNAVGAWVRVQEF